MSWLLPMLLFVKVVGRVILSSRPILMVDMPLAIYQSFLLLPISITRRDCYSRLLVDSTDSNILGSSDDSCGGIFDHAKENGRSNYNEINDLLIQDALGLMICLRICRSGGSREKN